MFVIWVFKLTSDFWGINWACKVRNLFICILSFVMFLLYLCRTAQVPEQRTLVMGSAHLEETVLGLKLQLLPTVHFWSNISAARMVCKGVEEMLSLTKKISLVEVGFGLGLVGLHLSRVRVAEAGLPLFVTNVCQEANHTSSRCQGMSGAQPYIL